MGADVRFGLTGVRRVAACDLRVVDEAWTYSRLHAVEIDRAWDRALVENPSFFNGTIYLMRTAQIVGDRFVATFLKTDFRSYLFWRRRGFDEAGVCDGFGSAILLSQERQVILGRQARGHVNAGLAYMPGGFIDERDIGADGCVDIDLSIAREVGEETGLDVGALDRVGGYYVTVDGAQVSIGIAYRSALAADDMAAGIRAHIASEDDSELADVVVVAVPPADGAIGFAAYAVPLLRAVLGDD